MTDRYDVILRRDDAIRGHVNGTQSASRILANVTEEEALAYKNRNRAAYRGSCFYLTIREHDPAWKDQERAYEFVDAAEEFDDC